MDDVEKFINYLIDASTPEHLIWNVEVMKLGKKPMWNYIDGVMMRSILDLYEVTGGDKYRKFVLDYLDRCVCFDGHIRGYQVSKRSLDDLAPSTLLFDAYHMTKKAKYQIAIRRMGFNLWTQPRTKNGLFWHKKHYPNQVWLDGFYMVMPFYTECLLYWKMNLGIIKDMYQKAFALMYNEKDHLLKHGYDASKKIFWADKETGLSASYWLRGIGWFTVSLMEVGSLAKSEEDRAFFKGMLKKTIDGLLPYMDKSTKMFYQVVDQGEREGNYLETSGSLMISYALLKGTRTGLLDQSYQKIGKDIYFGTVEHSFHYSEGVFSLDHICLSAGLGPLNKPHRDGSFKYYTEEAVVSNDAKGVAPLFMAYSEIKRLES